MATPPKTQDNYATEEQFKVVNDKLDQPHKFAEIFCEAAKSQKIVDETLKCIIRDLIKSDKDSIDYIKNMIREVEKEDLRLFVKKITSYGAKAFIFILGVSVTIIIEIIRSKFLSTK
jgi:hypothetical protein